MQATQSTFDQTIYSQQEPKYARAQLLYKTELCKKWMTYGTCPYKNQCRFAHGIYELKQRAPPNEYYKTKICFKFFNEFSCPYGSRCNFRHDKVNFSEQKRSYYQYLMNFNQLTLCKGYKPRRLPTFQLLEKGLSLDQESNCSTFLKNKEELSLSSGSKEILKITPVDFTPIDIIDLLGQKDNQQRRETIAAKKIQPNLDKNLTSFQICSVLSF